MFVLPPSRFCWLFGGSNRSSYSVFIRCFPLSSDGRIYPIPSAIARTASLHLSLEVVSKKKRSSPMIVLRMSQDFAARSLVRPTG